MCDAAQYRQRGAVSLIELSIIIVIAAAIAVAFLQTNEGVYGIKPRKDTVHALDRLDGALTNYVKINGRLPCPAALKDELPGLLQGANTNSFGGELRDPLTTRCTLSSSRGTFSNTTNTTGLPAQQLLIGAVPVRDLGLPLEDAVDSWGYRIQYVVPELNTRSETLGQAPGLILLRSYDNTKSTRENLDATGNIIRSDAPFVLLSTGADALGGFGYNGGNIVKSAVLTAQQAKDDSVEKENTILSGTSESASKLDEIFVMPTSPNPTIQFDDMLKPADTASICNGVMDTNALFFGNAKEKNVIGWYAAECAESDPASPNQVRRIIDRGPNSNDLIRFGANYPILDSNGDIVTLNPARTRPVVLFTSADELQTNDLLRHAGDTNPATNDKFNAPIFVYFVGQAKGASGSTVVYGPSAGALSNNYRGILNGGATQPFQFDPDGTGGVSSLTASTATTAANVQIDADKVNLYSMRFGAGTDATTQKARLRINGALVGNADATAAQWNSQKLTLMGGAGTRVPVRFGELLMIRGNLCPHEERRIERFLANGDRWNITLGFNPDEGANDIYHDGNPANGELAMWYDASNLCTIITNNAAIPPVSCSNSNADGVTPCASNTNVQAWWNVITQQRSTSTDALPLVTSSGTPQILQNQINGLSTVEFTNDAIGTNSVPGGTLNRPLTIFTVLRNPSGTILQGGGGLNFTATPGATPAWSFGGTSLAADASVGGLGGTTKATLHTIALTASSIRHYIAGSTITNGSAERTTNGNVSASFTNATALTQLILGNAASFSGQIAEVLVYQGDLPTAERATIERYLANKWNTCLQTDNQSVKYDVDTGTADKTICPVACVASDVAACTASGGTPIAAPACGCNCNSSTALSEGRINWNNTTKVCECPANQALSNGHCCPTGQTWDTATSTCGVTCSPVANEDTKCTDSAATSGIPNDVAGNWTGSCSCICPTGTTPAGGHCITAGSCTAPKVSDGAGGCICQLPKVSDGGTGCICDPTKKSNCLATSGATFDDATCSCTCPSGTADATTGACPPVTVCPPPGTCVNVSAFCMLKYCGATNTSNCPPGDPAWPANPNADPGGYIKFQMCSSTPSSPYYYTNFTSLPSCSNGCGVGCDTTLCNASQNPPCSQGPSPTCTPTCSGGGVVNIGQTGCECPSGMGWSAYGGGHCCPYLYPVWKPAQNRCENSSGCYPDPGTNTSFCKVWSCNQYVNKPDGTACSYGCHGCYNGACSDTRATVNSSCIIGGVSGLCKTSSPGQTTCQKNVFDICNAAACTSSPFPDGYGNLPVPGTVTTTSSNPKCCSCTLPNSSLNSYTGGCSCDYGYINSNGHCCPTGQTWNNGSCS